MFGRQKQPEIEGPKRSIRTELADMRQSPKNGSDENWRRLADVLEAMCEAEGIALDYPLKT